MPFFSLPNLQSQVIRQLSTGPWDEPPAPKDLLDKNKGEFSEWCLDPTTKHCFFSLAEGMDPLRRISDREGNRVVCLHGFIADIDHEIHDHHYSVEYITKKSKSEFLPNFVSRTHSRNGRIVWLFPNAIYFPNQEAADAFLKRFSEEIKVKSIWGALDPASYKANQYYERGREWLMVSADTVPNAMLEYWVLDSGRDIQYTDDQKELSIPWDKITDRMEELYPGKWPGKIEEGARGPAFWRDTRSGNSAVIRKGGIQDFGGSFRTWSSLLGAEWVTQQYSEQVGAVLSAVWFDDKHFYDWDPAKPFDKFQTYTQTNMERRLMVKWNLSRRRLDGQNFTQLDEVMVKAMEKRIKGTGPFLHFKPGLLRVGDEMYLNNCFVSALEPAPDPVELTGGANLPIPFGHNFPYIASFLKHVFPKDRKNGSFSLEYMLSWLRYGYVNAYYRVPKMGQVFIGAGPQNSGKTFFCEMILCPLLGGFGTMPGRPFAYATNRTDFNDQLMFSPVWSLDDENVKTEKDNAAYTNFLKQAVANGSQRWNQKFMKELNVQWRGRVFVAFNEDSHSSRQMPNLEISNLDKMMLFRMNGGFKFLPLEEGRKKLKEELPHFARWLMNWKIPAHCVGLPRFGVKTYHDSYLLRMGYENSSNYEFSEMLQLFLRNYELMHIENKDQKSHWVGTSSQLAIEMSQWNPAVVRTYNARAIGRTLSDLRNRGLNLETKRTEDSRTWYIPIELKYREVDSADEDADNVEPVSDEDIEMMNQQAIAKDV